ncbi:MAG TPA: tetratricopeptide repeat protein [Planktothrix sp.]|jgi:folate-binding protein YgfZ
MPDETSVQMKRLRETGGFWKADPYGLIEVYGKDDMRFLQAQTTNDVAQLGQCNAQSSCLLDRKAHILAAFDLYRRHDSYRIIVEKSQVDSILTHLEQYRIADKVEFLDLSNTGKFFVIQGPKSRRVIHAGLRNHPGASIFRHDVIDLKLWDTAVHLFRKSITGEDGYFLWVTNSDADKLWSALAQACKAIGLIPLDDELLQIARVESGIPKFAVDFNSENFLPETGLEHLAVSYTKGCFLGQEVLARVKSQGAPTRGLVGLLFPPGEHWTFPHDSSVQLNGEEIASLKSNIYSPTLDRVIALASAKRDYRAPGKSFAVTINSKACTIEVTDLPFVQAISLADKARGLYEEALQLYAKESETSTSSRAVELLEDALDMSPGLEDAYEALGVILSKRGRLDDAISLMRQLAELNSDSIMAHTNLSVFYMEKNLIEQAEEEKAISMSIRMRIAARQATLEKEQKEKKTEEREETLQRLEMFQQVIAIDAEDLLANYGVGSCFVALGEFSQAIPFLRKAIEVKPTHTVAYISLGEAYEGLGDVSQAVASYEKGIDVASARGDMTPLKEMQSRLAALKTAKSGEPA